MSNVDKIKKFERADIVLSFETPEQALPLIISPKDSSLDLLLWGKENKEYIKSLINIFGGLLFRGFDSSSPDRFEQFIDNVSSEALKYSERSSPRHAVNGNIYTSTDHPEDKEIFLHNEQSYNVNFPMRIFFYCVTPASEGGNTPLADVRNVYNRLTPEIIDKFLKKQYRYSRYFWPMMGMTWQQAFQTADKREVETYCKSNQIHYKWIDDALSTYQLRPVAAKHPYSSEMCWFNHCTFFHISQLDEETQEMLICSFEEDELPNNTFYGDGISIEKEVMNALRSAYQMEKKEFSWQKGDLLMLDNMMVAHGRGSFKGDRKILVGMSELISWAEVTHSK